MDGRQLLDLSMGFGAMLVGHLNPVVVEHVQRALTDVGTLFVTPSPQATEMSERFCRRFGLDMIRFTNSGTEVADVRHPRGPRVHRPQGDREDRGRLPRWVRRPPDLGEAGARGHRPGRCADPRRALRRRGRHGLRRPLQRPRPYLEKIFAEHAAEIGVMVIEPVVENLSIVVPDEGYLAGVRAACDKHGIVLVFDEVKTGLTAGYAGAAQRLGVQPDLITLAKTIGGGLPAGGVRRQARGDGGRRRRADGPLRHLQRQPARHGGRDGRRRDLHPRGARRRRGGSTSAR